ncbi:helix-turn-helix transcriptional regulator [Paracoccus caeni]|uniref:Helix-turn-helix transcriptional regulator n=1 Tax=Paracoccus caeni TaxID=657651 RepID=A0A934SHR5_9RHOB|nr:TetR/AcrR family transcriptional regulator [Paracoccus caeni]MBK4217660.1 helix-turn-helix transcriptional regulator [Paracoccus caeni]
MTSSRLEKSQLSVARAAARLFLEKGFAATSGSDIAEAVGISERTVWRYFRTKESCVAPLFELSSKQYAEDLRDWPRSAPIEEQFAERFDLHKISPEDSADGVLIVRLIAALPEEPDLRTTWLLSYDEGVEPMARIIGDRLDRSHREFEVRLCAAAVMAAIRTIDETISMAAIRDGQHFTTDEVVVQLSRAIRAVSNLPFCDPVVPKPFGDTSSA